MVTPPLVLEAEDAEKLRYCRECWNGNSRDGIFTNGDGYHYYEMLPDGTIQKAFEYYENEEAEEHALPLTEFIGTNWYEIFGANEEEILEIIPEHEFNKVMNLAHEKE